MANIDTSSYWIDNTPAPRFSALKEDIAVDVLVIGAGITGITAAYLLKRAGYNVALVDKDRCLSGDTSNTTAHLTCVTDTLLSDLVKNFGEDHAQAVWDAQLAAIDMIDRIVWREQIKCQFDWVPGYLFNPSAATGQTGSGTPRRSIYRKKQRSRRELGFDAEYVDARAARQPAGRTLRQPGEIPPAEISDCAPAPALQRQRLPGVRAHERRRDRGHAHHRDDLRSARGFIASTCSSRRTCRCRARSDSLPRPILQSKLAPYSSYVVGGWVPRGTVPEALYWDTGDPYDYVRVDRRHDHDFVIFGGEDHKTGQVEETQQCFTRLEQRSSICCREIAITHRWSGQVIETNDGLPYIGETAERQYAATGFGGNGMTFGTLSAMMFADYVAEQTNPWAELFDTGRTKIKGGLWNYLKENKDYPYYLIRDRFAGKGGRSLRSIPRGHGEVVDIDGQAAAVYRGLDGEIHVRSAVCTHMGCYVHFNDAEHTWDCPCHGSRFKVNGEVLAGPAEKPLRTVDSRQSAVDSRQS